MSIFEVIFEWFTEYGFSNYKINFSSIYLYIFIIIVSIYELATEIDPVC